MSESAIKFKLDSTGEFEAVYKIEGTNNGVSQLCNLVVWDYYEFCPSCGLKLSWDQGQKDLARLEGDCDGVVETKPKR